MLDQTLLNEIGTRKSFNVGKASGRLLIWTDGVARVSGIISRNKGQGEGSELMTQICKYADENGLDLSLYVQRYGDPHQGLSNEQLISFYMKFGFYIEDDGKKPVMMWRDSQE